MAEGTTNGEIIEVAYGAVRSLSNSFKIRGVNIESRLFVDSVLSTLVQHRAHLDVHGVDQKHVDPYKIVCWLGCSILEGLDHDSQDFPNAVAAVVQTLVGFLDKDSKGRVVVPRSTQLLLIQMLIEEKRGLCNHGIWQNGLYAAFHCAVVVLKALDEPLSRLDSI